MMKDSRHVRRTSEPRRPRQRPRSNCSMHRNSRKCKRDESEVSRIPGETAREDAVAREFPVF
jgi:hypothetical protein